MPAWSHDGRELYYYSMDGRIMAATVQPGTTFAVGVPRQFAAVRIRFGGGVSRNEFDVSRDGRLLLNVAPNDVVMPPITLVQNWRRLMDGGK